MNKMLYNIPHRDASIGANSSTTTEQKTDIVFIDSRAEDYQSLVAYVTAGTEETEVIILDPTQDSIEQMTQVLASRHDVKEVHIVSHGEEGSLQLSSTQLKAGNLDGYSSQLQELMGQSSYDHTLESVLAFDAWLWDAYYLCSI